MLTETDRDNAATKPVLRAESVSVSYGRRQVLFDVSVAVNPSEVVCVVGHNGAGKTSLLNAIAGIVPAAGTIELGGEPRRGRGVPDRLGLVPSEGCVFPTLSVRDNLRLGGKGTGGEEFERRFEHAVELFPILSDRLGQAAGSMSGGEQRMLGIAVALMRKPELLLLDEPSIGLAPAIADAVFETVARLAREEGVAVLLVEQSIVKALAIADRAQVMRSGRVIAEATGSELGARADLWELF